MRKHNANAERTSDACDVFILFTLSLTSAAPRDDDDEVRSSDSSLLIGPLHHQFVFDLTPARLGGPRAGSWLCHRFHCAALGNGLSVSAMQANDKLD
ncbi:hypothetical protein EVAR_68029_1 [Eumeta japonica]|uniref:Uncharacterized protein n=1 Tax=Eumeta variegata TaxID=151549 RepID=A0A4C1SUG4_EUMVA|nr:hypothetical protein EVAR_68029_1 [Eumeta japonica]